MSEHIVDGAARTGNPSENLTETWKPVVRFEGLYEVSNLGGVRRATNAPACNSTKPGKLLAFDYSTGYARVSLNRDGRCTRALVHRLVAGAFLPPGVERQHVNHIDGDKRNNHATNLEWVTHRENVLHAWRTGLSIPAQGEDSGNSKLCERDVRVIRDAAARGVTGRSLAAVYNVTEANISSIVRFQTWTHLKPESEAS